jgi:hypothetical protein
MRTQFSGGKGGSESQTENGNLDVQVQIEQAVMVDYDPIVYGRENYRKPRTIWDQKQSTVDGESSSLEQNRWELSSVKGATRAADAV